MVGASVGQALYDEYAACLGTGASADACAAIFAKDPPWLLGVQTNVC